MKKALMIAAALMALLATSAEGCGKQGGTGGPKPKLTGRAFDADCKGRGGTPVTVRKGHSVSRICEPPAGGWQ